MGTASSECIPLSRPPLHMVVGFVYQALRRRAFSKNSTQSWWNTESLRRNRGSAIQLALAFLQIGVSVRFLSGLATKPCCRRTWYFILLLVCGRRTEGTNSASLW